MLKVEHLTLQDDKGHKLLKDVSFSLPNQGIISIHCDTPIVHHYLAQVLAGIAKPETGTLHYNVETLSSFSEEERSHYRSTFVISLFHELQILKEKSVYSNITMGLEYPNEKIEQELKHWGLYEKQNVLAEDLSTKEQWSMVLMRCALRQPMMLVIDTQSTPLSYKELVAFYPLLEDLRGQMLIVVIGDQRCYPFSNRIIEIANGYILSDSNPEHKNFTQINHNRDVFQLTRSNIAQLHELLHNHIRWKLRCASVLCVVAFITLSTAFFSTTLNITDIQSRVMKSKNSSIVAIEKTAKTADGFQNNYYATFQQEDIEVLQKNLQGDLIFGYYPVDTLASMLYAYGTTIDINVKNSLDDYTIIEADSSKELGLNKMIGRYPENYQEIALSSSQAFYLLEEQLQEPYLNTEEQNLKMLNSQVSWFHTPLTITAIFPSQQIENSNMELDMRGYNGESEIGSMMDHSFYVRKGFCADSSILNHNVYAKTYKRIVSENRLLSEFKHILALEHDVYYYNGKEVVHDDNVTSNEVLLDFDMALDMGYRNVYLNGVINDEVSFADRVENYQNFADEYIGKTINIQTYEVADHPLTSSLMNVEKKIKGFVIPITYDYLESYARDDEQEGTLYVHPTLIAKDNRSKNMYIKEVYYHSDDETKLKEALSYLNKKPEYSAFLFKSPILQFFVVDLKNLDTLLFTVGGISLIVFLAILLFLLKSSIQVMRNELSIYYLFGERESMLKKMMIRYFSSILWMRALFGWLCGTLALSTFIFMIYFALSASPSILWCLALPILMLLSMISIVKASFYITMCKAHVIEEEFMDMET